MDYMKILTIIVGLFLIVFGILIRKTKIINVQKLTLYVLEDKEGYRIYLSRNFISAGIWLLVCVVTNYIWNDIELIKMNLLTILFVVFEYKINAGKYMLFDSETGIIKRK